jgi:hypothetical protein
MAKVVKVKGLCSRPLQRRILEASEAERAGLLETVEAESSWMIEKMGRKGYTLEAVVAGVYGVFTRGPAAGKLELRRRAVSEN